MLRDLGRFVKWLLGLIATIIAVVTVLVFAYGEVGKGWRLPWDPQSTTTTFAPNAGPPAVAGLLNADEFCDGYDRDAFGDFHDAVYTEVRARAANVDQWTGKPLGADDRPQVDHIVPVHEAYCSGLPEAAYTAFYNDPENLLLTAGSVNAAKSDLEPGEWEAPSVEAECRFAAVWVHIKTKWGLTADPAETARLANLIGACQ